MFQINGTFCKGLKINVGVMVIFHIYWTLYMIVQSKVKNMPVVAHNKQYKLLCVWALNALFLYLGFLFLNTAASCLSFCLVFGEWVIGFIVTTAPGFSHSVSSFLKPYGLPLCSALPSLTDTGPHPLHSKHVEHVIQLFNGSTLSCQSLAPKGV